MTHHKNFNNESQDARRHDQFHQTHPEEAFCKQHQRMDRCGMKQTKQSHKKK